MIPNLTAAGQAARLTTLRTHATLGLANNANTILVNDSLVAISAILGFSNRNDLAGDVAGWYNLAAAGPFVVWRDIDISVVQDNAILANMTPLGTPPTTPDSAMQAWIARCVTCQGKQLNYHSLTVGRTKAPMKLAGYRAALQDCLTQIPAGTNGALIAAGWSAIEGAAKFNATNAERIFATGTGTTGSPGNLGPEGELTPAEVIAAWNLT